MTHRKSRMFPATLEPGRIFHTRPLKGIASRGGAAILGIFLIALACSIYAQAPAGGGAGSKTGVQVESQVEVSEVLLDLVARDRGGKLVRDLKESEIEVYEDGVRQKVNSFTVVEKGDLKLGLPSGPAPSPAAQEDSLRQVNLVTMVFERLSEEGRSLALSGALQFLKTELRNNVFVSVFVIDQRLMILQPFTNDHAKLRAAIEKATARAYSQFITDSASIRSSLEQSASALAAANSMSSSVGRNSSPSPEMGSAYIEARLAEAAANSLNYADAMAQDQQSRASVFSLLSLVRAQRSLHGRKTLLYFTQSMMVTPVMADYLRTVISDANRANVSIYAIDARGLLTTDQNQASITMLGTATAQIRNQTQRSGGAVSRQDVLAGEQAEASIRANFQETLAALSEQTGGKLIGNSNDLGLSMKRVSEDLRAYYELAYSSSNPRSDGKFREIAVKVLRRGVTVQTRKGYYAVPYTEAGAPLSPVEFSLVGVLSSRPLPHDFDYRAAVLHFDPTSEGVMGSLVVEIPLSQISFKSVPAENKFASRFTLLALLKDQDGRLLKTFSQDYDYQGELPKLEEARRNSVLFVRHFVLPQGRYSLETVIRDADAERTSARRSIFLFPPSRAGVRMSSLSVIRRITMDSSESTGDQDPFRLKDTRLFPALGGPLQLAARPSIYLYLVAYPDAARPEPTRLILEFLQNGLTVSQAQIDLPAADAQGRIPYLANVSTEGLKPGDYEIRAVVTQGDSAVEEHAFLTLVE